LATGLPRHELLEPFCIDATDEAIAYSKALLYIVASPGSEVDPDVAEREKFFANVDRMTGHPSAAVNVDTTSRIALIDAEPDVFPCLLVIVGSCTIFMKVKLKHYFSHLETDLPVQNCIRHSACLIVRCSLLSLRCKGRIKAESS
jgi:hypothetical protein